LNAITLHIDGVAVPALRPRVTRGGRHTYDPPKSSNWKALVAYQIMAQRPPTLEGPLSVTMVFLLPKPKSRRKKDLHPIGRPDLSNLAKAVEDAINQTGMVWKDDSQVVELHCQKSWVSDGIPPAVGISVKTMSNNTRPQAEKEVSE